MERFSDVLWAPAGGWLVVFSAGTASGNIMFIDSNGTRPTRTNLVEYPGFNKVGLVYVKSYVFRQVINDEESDKNFSLK